MSTQFPIRTLADRWRRHCGNKVAYPDRPSASSAAAKLEVLERAKFNAYQCDCCGKFHVGHARKESPWLGARDKSSRRNAARPRRQRNKVGGRSANIPSVFQSRKEGFAKIRDGRPLQGGRIESDRSRH